MSICAKTVFLVGMSKMRFSKNMHFCFCLFMLLQERPIENKMEKGQKNKNCVFQVGIPKMRKMTKRTFCKNRLTPFVSGREKKREFSCTLSVLHTFWGAPKQWKPRKNNRNGGFSGNRPKPKMTPFFENKVFFGLGEKVVLLIVSLKTVFSLKHYFCSVFSKAQQLQ